MTLGEVRGSCLQKHGQKSKPIQKKVNFPNFLNAECNHAETRVLWRTLFSFFWVVCVVGFVLTTMLEMF
jgi:hypothetical protein